MTLREVMDKVIRSHRDDWHKITCWGANTGPAYRDRFTFWETWESTNHGVLQSESHSNVAVYMPDVSITLAFGLHHLDNFREDWANKFADHHDSSSYVDVFYNNALIFRDVYVTVDGGRTKLPLPRRIFDDAKEKVVGLEVPRRRHDFIRLVESLEGTARDFDDYARRAGFKVVDEDWPELGSD